MEVKRVKCSNCGIILEVKNSKNEAVKLITCPQCKAPLRVRFQPQQPLEVETVLPGCQPAQQRVAPQNDGETLLGGRQDSERTILGQGCQQGAATACLVLAGQQYVLRQGANTVGRKAQTSQATLQLPVSDPYMSRHHLQIVVSVLPNGKLKAVITQNIDGLHQKAGSRCVYEIHGSALRNYCMRCGKIYPSDYIFESEEPIPHCSCGGVIRPDITLYEESLPEAAVRGAIQAISEADMLIIGGTSLTVYPAASYIQYFRGKYLVIINRDALSVRMCADTLLIQDKIGEVFTRLAELQGLKL